MGRNRGPVTGEERGRLKGFFPRGCAFFWNGSGKVPIAPLLVLRQGASLRAVCAACASKSECTVAAK